MTATARIAFGVDLGDGGYGEWPFEADEADEWAEEGPEWEGLLHEFAGWAETPLPYGKNGTPEYDAWSAQLDRKSAFKSGIQYGSYGYEYSGTYLTVGVGYRVDWGCEPVGTLDTPDPEKVTTLVHFIEFLDTKGLKLKPEHRTPHWMLMASYG